MKLLHGLTVLLCLSLALNAYLLMEQKEQPEQQARSPSAPIKTPDTRHYPEADDLDAEESLPFATEPDDTRKKLEEARAMLAQRRFDALRYVLQQHLQRFPDDVPFLLLEADLIAATASASESLGHYYQVLDLPLTDEQRLEVEEKIARLSDDNIEKLQAIRAWDILASFMEPLWQFAPDKRRYILVLAEAYARQQMVSLTEHVLASVLPDDPDAIKIRQLLQTQNPEASTGDTTAPLSRPELQYERAIPMTRRGDHFVVTATVGNGKVNLLLDTGASSTVLNQAAFERISRRNQTRYIGRYQVNTAGGPVVAPVYQVESVNIGGYAAKDIAIVVLPIDDFGGAEGLLGMNYLREFRFAIDQQNATLMLSP